MSERDEAFETWFRNNYQKKLWGRPSYEKCKLTWQAAIASQAVADTHRPYAEFFVGSDRYAICDWEDFDLVKAYNWRLSTRSRKNDVYGALYAQAWKTEHKGERVSMHRLILPPPEGMYVDHINGNGLDNRRANLRIATNQQNSFNTRAKRKNKYKGVSLEKASGLYRAYITLDGQRKHLGRHATEEEAAKAYNLAARIYHKEFARLNDVD